MIKSTLLIAVSAVAWVGGCATPEPSLPPLFGSSASATEPPATAGDWRPRGGFLPGAVREKLKPAQSYGLTVEERAALENVVRQAYTVPEAAQILTVTAGRTATGSIVACGTANARRSDGTMSEARLFRAEGVPTAWGVPDFQLKQMAAANASSIEVYAACRDLGLV